MIVLGSLVIFTVCLFQLVLLFKDMENKIYVNNSYKHSAEHFAYLLMYMIGFLALAIGIDTISYFCIFIGTIVLQIHIYKEQKGFF